MAQIPHLRTCFLGVKEHIRSNQQNIIIINYSSLHQQYMHGMMDEYGNSRGDVAGSNFEGNQADSLFMDVYAVYSG